MMRERPNIIFIFTDQQRADTMGCYGQKLNVTPNLDKIAKEGVRFTHAFTNQPVCGPARSIIQSGKYASEVGCFRNGIALPENINTLANILTSNGYDVGYTGKWHLASKNYSREPVPLEKRGGYNGFWKAAEALEHTSHGYGGHVWDENNEIVEFEGYRVDAITDYAIEFIENRPKDKPFFLFVSYLEPHHQNDHKTFEGPKGYREKFENFEVPADLKGLKGDWLDEFGNYLACCHCIDENVGRIQQKISELGLFDDTVIIYTSDHGCHFRTRIWEYKRSCHDSSTHVPLIIKGPGFEPKTVTDFVQTIDMMPTVLDIAGVKIPEFTRGISAKSIVDGKFKSRGEVFIQISESQIGRAIRTKKWKYSVKAPFRSGFFSRSSKIYREEYLYDLENDLAEHNNLVKDMKYKNIRKELKEKLLSYVREIEGYTPIIWNSKRFKIINR